MIYEDFLKTDELIITDNLKIRKFTIDDVSAYFKNNSDPQMKIYMPNHWCSTEDEAREEITEFLSDYKLDYKDIRKSCHFAITKYDMLIGHIGMGESDIGDDVYEICCAIGEDCRGLGYAVEAVKAFVLWCKATFGLDKIYASTDRENTASRKCLLNAGFVLTDIAIKDKELIVYVFD